jgi:hypothetical protein
LARAIHRANHNCQASQQNGQKLSHTSMLVALTGSVQAELS